MDPDYLPDAEQTLQGEVKEEPKSELQGEPEPVFMDAIQEAPSGSEEITAPPPSPLLARNHNPLPASAEELVPPIQAAKPPQDVGWSDVEVPSPNPSPK